MSKDNMLAVEPGGNHCAYKELRPVSITASVRHGK
eukprot:XP_001706630.1 Hypothetical protein GL50803_35778 [Giardia lamblia ATCC 50803]